MTLGTLVLLVAVIALVLTFIIGATTANIKNWLVSYLQNAAGVLFIFSGWVKAIDPLGTAYKMEQYFAEFESTFQGTWFSFLSPLFPQLSEQSVTFSVVMIVFETVLGLLLIMGGVRKFAAWAFFLMVAFFTFLTGFTYLTGYVPDGVNFFSFTNWGPYVETNMKVTDCGCFGDFIKLPPKTSFLKDIVLLVPALAFITGTKQMHQLFTPGTRTMITILATAGLTLYCFSNFYWDLPHTDFRPFREGVNIRERRALEEEAQNNVQIEAYRITNKESGKVVELPFDQYMKEFQNYPKEEWDLQQVKSEPEVPRTKISDFDVADIDGNEITQEILDYAGFSFMIVAFKLDGERTSQPVTIMDTLYVTDTLQTGDSIVLQQRVNSVIAREVTRDVYSWGKDYLEPWTAVVNPVMDAAQSAGIMVYAITAYADPGMIDDFRHATQSGYPFFMADDILLKTIIRSNPGIVLLHDGAVVKKWHYKKLPSFEEIQNEFLGQEAGGQ